MTSLGKKYPDLASTQFRIRGVLKNFHPGERIQKLADSYVGFTGYVCTESESAKKKFRIKKYPVSCGRGLSNDDDDNDSVIKATGLD